MYICINENMINQTIQNKSALVALVVLFTFASCSKKNFSHLPEYSFKATNNQPDYSNLSYWAAHAYKKDPSDSVPKSLLKNFEKDSMVDVFFVHPTTLTSKKHKGNNAFIDDAKINAKTDYGSILYQASIFNEQCRVFAPRYRQAHYRSFFMPEEKAQPYFDMAYKDVSDAFLYYLKNLNNGRPLIIAAHSQGTLHAARLIKDYIENTTLKNKIVAIYLIGLPVAENYFTNILPCQNADETGCFVSWRTFKSGYQGPKYIKKETFKAIVTNPLTWSTDTLKAPSANSLGGILFNFNKVIPKLVNAQVHKNILWVTKPDIFGKILYRKKNYHVGDMNIFYVDIRENVKRKIGMYWKR
jgi:hypothetical protein